MQTVAESIIYDTQRPWWQTTRRGMANAREFIRKDVAIAVSYRLQFLFQFSQVFFKVAVIYFIGQMVSSSGVPGALASYRGDYFSFALVGLAVNGHLNAAMVAITDTIRRMMDTGVLEAICASPVKSVWLLLYTSLWPFLFATIRATLYLILGICVFDARFAHANWPGAVVVTALATPVFLMLAITSSSLLIVIKRGDPTNWFFTSISGLLAGTMFPITVLPGWLYVTALCLPMTHALEALRQCLLVGTALSGVADHLLALVAFAVVLLPVTVAVNRVCMIMARRTGAFSTH